MVLASPAQRVQVGDDNTLTCEQLSPTELSLKAKAVGTTELNPGSPIPRTRASTRFSAISWRVFPDSQGKALLRGDTQALADEINRAFPKARLLCLSLVTRLQSRDRLRTSSSGANPADRPRTRTAETRGEEATLTATINEQPDSPDAAAHQLQRVAGPNVLNQLRVACGQQVMLRVTVAEVNRAAARSIGLNCSVERHDGVTVFATRTGELAGVTNMGGVNAPVFLDNGQIGLAIHALRGMNLAKSIAEPRLTALSGYPAEFTTGGKFPVPSGDGVTFIPYGVHLNFTPFVLDQRLSAAEFASGSQHERHRQHCRCQLHASAGNHRARVSNDG